MCPRSAPPTLDDPSHAGRQSGGTLAPQAFRAVLLLSGPTDGAGDQVFTAAIPTGSATHKVMQTTWLP